MISSGWLWGGRITAAVRDTSASIVGGRCAGWCGGHSPQFPRHPDRRTGVPLFEATAGRSGTPGQARGDGSVGLAGCLIQFVTPDLVRGPPGRGGRLDPLAVPLAAEWTPERVRGDGGFGACLALSFVRGIWGGVRSFSSPRPESRGPALLGRLREEAGPRGEPGVTGCGFGGGSHPLRHPGLGPGSTGPRGEAGASSRLPRRGVDPGTSPG